MIRFLAVVIIQMRDLWRHKEDNFPAEEALITASGLLLGKWYLDTYQCEEISPASHYLRIGASSGFNPNPLFWTRWYLEQYPDVNHAGINPLVHFIKFGRYENRCPCPLFDTGWYLKNYKDVGASGVNPLLHYLMHGAREERNPHPLFNTAWYLERNTDVGKSRMNPLEHFLCYGFKEGRDPNPLFDTDWYAEKYINPFSAEVNPLIHYLTTGSQAGYNPHPDFDTEWYLQEHPEIIKDGINPLIHFFSQGEKAGYRTKKTDLHSPRYKLIPAKKTFIHTGKQQSEKLITLSRSLIDWDALRNSKATRTKDLVSIILLCYGNDELTTQCVNSILRNSKGSKYEYELLMVDNAGRDQTRAIALEASQQNGNVRYHRNVENYMFSLGNNVGVAASKGEYLILLNNDTIVLDGWLDPLIDPLSEDTTTGAVGPKLLYQDDSLQCGGIVFNTISSIPYHIYQHQPRHSKAINKPRNYQAVTGACLAMRAVDYITLNGLDPVFINGCEDLDLCFRIKTHLSKSILYNPESEIYHLEGKSDGRGKFIMYNREVFVNRWRDRITPDDTQYYDEDGYLITAYYKKGTEPHGETAAYYPELREKPVTEDNKVAGATGKIQVSGADVGFSTMWYQRGIAFHTRQLALALESRNIRTHIFARWESARFANSGMIHHPRVLNAGDDPSEERIVQWARGNNIRLMIFMEVHPNDWKRVRALKCEGIKVLCYENLDILRIEDWGKYEIFDAFLFNAFHTREVMLKRFPEKPSIMLPWGVIPIDPEPGMAKENRPLRFVHVAGWGGLNNRKNTGLLIKAFNKADPGNAELHLYTQAPVGSYGAEVLRILEEDTRIYVTEGTVENIFEAYKGMDMLLWPSKREGLGLPIIEALSCGLPVLVTDGFMMKQWIIPGKHGVLCGAQPVQSDKYLPEMHVCEEDLIDLIRKLASAPERIREMAENVVASRDIWSWNWQSGIFRDQIAAMISEHKYIPAADLGYLPRSILEFEQERKFSGKVYQDA